MKIVNSLKRISSPSPRAASPVRSPLHGSFKRNTSVTSAPSLGKAAVESATARESNAHAGANETESATVPAVDPLPQHDDVHVGPYGVEAPLDWTYIVIVSEVTVAVQVESDGEKGTFERGGGG
ncbi:hypothetical protein BDW02DRAFT_578360 [Decorospora gaudefroyi]|uniref:Uncharacterized protein n=1 Tax=Decorospora gaudefroyi TaxID=184978 RepID=A0A6A5KJA3_9PLEO|nr:hypothetical protein BDW02DRAFT_578360 [Decorospora gaudefroyi]